MLKLKPAIDMLVQQKMAREDGNSAEIIHAQKPFKNYLGRDQKDLKRANIVKIYKKNIQITITEKILLSMYKKKCYSSNVTLACKLAEVCQS